MIEMYLVGTSGFIERLHMISELIRNGRSYCARHPNVETGLKCSRCEVFICPQCLVQAYVGERCPDCAKVRVPLGFELSITNCAVATCVGIVLACATGGLWGLMFLHLFRLPFLPWLVVIGIGYLIGECISASVNHKKGRYLQYMAGMCMGLSYLVAGLVTPLMFVHGFRDILFVAMLGIGVFVAAGRVR